MWLIHIENSFSQNGILILSGHSINNPSDSTTKLSEYQQVLPYGPCQAIANTICYPCGKYPTTHPMRRWQKLYESVGKLHSSMITWQHGTSGPVPELDTDTNLITAKSTILWICLCRSQITTWSTSALRVIMLGTVSIDAGNYFSHTRSAMRWSGISSQGKIHPVSQCNEYIPFYSAVFHFLWSFLLSASLHGLHWTALWYLSSYILKYLQCPFITNHQSPSEVRVILGCSAWNIVSKF